MAQRRQRTKDEDIHAPSAKRARYDHERDFYSLPQYNKPSYHHRYELRSTKPIDYCQSSRVKSSSNAKPSTEIPKPYQIVTRNAHSYSINALTTRCSNSSTASARNKVTMTTEIPPSKQMRPRRKRKITQDEDFVSIFGSINHSN